MTPRTVAAWSLSAIAVIVLTNNPVYRALVALAALNLVLARRRPGASMRALLGMLATFAAVTALYNPLMSHAGAHRLAELPAAIPGIGGAVTLESLAFGLSAALGVVAAALAVAPLVMVLDPTDLLEVLPPRIQGTGTALAASLNLVPAVARSFVSVREAELLRGGSSRRNPMALLRTVVPVALTTMDASITLAEAMEARAYGSGPRTRYRQSIAGAADRLVLGASVASVVVILAARALGSNLDWYPFPTLTWPEISVVGVGACLLLAVPLAIPRAGR